jgi:hypothetical protein
LSYWLMYSSFLFLHPVLCCFLKYLGIPNYYFKEKMH